jgi:hypothetical protein
MESLAFIVFVLICAVMLCGPTAVGLAYGRYSTLALFVGGLAVFLGVYWFGTIGTSAKYLGLCSALMGLWALLRATGDLYR